MRIEKVYINYKEKIKQNYILILDRDSKNIITVSNSVNGKKIICYTEIDKRGKKASITKAIKNSEEWFELIINNGNVKSTIDSMNLLKEEEFEEMTEESRKSEVMFDLKMKIKAL